jgi:FdrA protein
MKEKEISQEKIKQLLNAPMVAVNVGVKSFSDNLEKQNVEVVHVNWRPPAGGDHEMMDILEDLL